MTTRRDIIAEAERLVDTLKARGETHGQGDANFKIMAELLNLAGYRREPPTLLAVDDRSGDPLDALDACIIYEISKLARVICGDRLEPDHYLDTAGYSIIAAAVAREMKARNEGARVLVPDGSIRPLKTPFSDRLSSVAWTPGEGQPDPLG